MLVEVTEKCVKVLEALQKGNNRPYQIISLTKISRTRVPQILRELQLIGLVQSKKEVPPNKKKEVVTWHIVPGKEWELKQPRKTKIPVEREPKPLFSKAQIETLRGMSKKWLSGSQISRNAGGIRNIGHKLRLLRSKGAAESKDTPKGIRWRLKPGFELKSLVKGSGAKKKPR